MRRSLALVMTVAACASSQPRSPGYRVVRETSIGEVLTGALAITSGAAYMATIPCTEYFYDPCVTERQKRGFIMTGLVITGIVLIARGFGHTRLEPEPPAALARDDDAVTRAPGVGFPTAGSAR